MTSIPDHYAALGIDPTADPEVITAAYRALAKKFHPDTGAAAGTASPERFDQIQRAYEVLRNPDTRHAYDLELLEATERELQEHLAAKRRVVVREPARKEAPPPDLDLGDIRPEPAVPPRVAAAARARKPRSLMPFLVPLLLVAMVGGGAAVMMLPAGPAAPPLPAAVEKQVAATTAEDAAPAEQPPAGTSAAPAAPAPQGEAPVFGSPATDEKSDMTAEADATAEPASAPPPAAAEAAGKPVFGSTGSEAAPATTAAVAPEDPEGPAATEAAPPPVPKAKPAQPAKQAQKPAQKPVQKQAQPAAKPPVQQPRARLAYQDPPEYFPEPDGFPPPPPGMEPPGFDPEYPPPGYDDEEVPPPGFRPGRGPYRLVIWERQPGRQATAWSAGVVFKSMGKCTRQGVKAVLRRTGGMDGYGDGTRIWYECQQFSQR